MCITLWPGFGPKINIYTAHSSYSSNVAGKGEMKQRGYHIRINSLLPSNQRLHPMRTEKKSVHTQLLLCLFYFHISCHLVVNHQN